MFKNSQSPLCLITCNQLHSTWLYIHQIITNRHKNRKLWTKTTVPILYSLSWKQDYCPHPIRHKNRTTVPIQYFLSWKQNFKKSSHFFYALLRNVSHVKTEKTEFNNCLSVCRRMSVFACINTCADTCILSASLTRVFFSLFFFPPERFSMELSRRNWDSLKQRYAIQSFLTGTFMPKQFPSRQQLLSATFIFWLPAAVGS